MNIDCRQKLRNNGYWIVQIRRIIVNGIKGFEKKVLESRNGNRNGHRTAQVSQGKRSRKKLIDRTDW